MSLKSGILGDFGVGFPVEKTDLKSEIVIRKDTIDSEFEARKKSNSSVNIPLLDFTKLNKP